MASEEKYFKIGIFVLGAVVILAGGIVVLGAGTVLEKKLRVETYIDESIQGLEVGAPVKYRGVRVGELEKVDFVAKRYGAQDGRIRLTMAFRQDAIPKNESGGTEEIVQHLSGMGMRIRLASAGLAGGVYLELDLLDPKQNPPPQVAWTPEFPVLPSVQSTGTRLTGHVETILEQIQKMKLDEVSEKVIHLLESLDAVVKKADPAIGDVKTLAADADGLVKDLRRMIQEDVGKELRELLSSTKDVMEKEVGPAVKSARAAADHLPATFEKMDATLDRIGSTLRRVDRTLAEEGGSMDEALDNLRVATGDLRDLMGQVKRYPAQALFGEAPPKKKVNP